MLDDIKGFCFRISNVKRTVQLTTKWPAHTFRYFFLWTKPCGIKHWFLSLYSENSNDGSSSSAAATNCWSQQAEVQFVPACGTGTVRTKSQVIWNFMKKIPDVKIFWFLGRQKLLTYCSSFSCWLLGLQYWSVRQSIQRHILKKDLDQIFLRISVHFPCEQTSLRKLQKSITMSVSSFLLSFFSISVDNLIGAPIYVSLQSSKKKSLHRIEMSISFISGLRKEQLLSQLLMEQKHICHHPHPSKPYLDCNILLVADHGTTRVLFFSPV